jgi:hypothetical protein
MAIKQRTIRARIASGTAASNAIDLEGGEIVAIVTPAGWDAASLTFSATHAPRSGSGENLGVYGSGTYNQVNDDDGGGALTIATAQMAANSILVRDTILNKLKGLQHIKLLSGTVAAAVNQTADRDIWLIIQPQP